MEFKRRISGKYREVGVVCQPGLAAVLRLRISGRNGISTLWKIREHLSAPPDTK